MVPQRGKSPQTHTALRRPDLAHLLLPPLALLPQKFTLTLCPHLGLWLPPRRKACDPELEILSPVILSTMGPLSAAPRQPCPLGLDLLLTSRALLRGSWARRAEQETE
jgi:hypothetical protein